MALVAPGPPKLCPMCGFKRPRSDFYAFRKDGQVYTHALCKSHANAQRVKDKNANPESRRAVVRRYRKKRRNDPERHAIDNDYRRGWYRRKHGVTPDRYRTGGTAGTGGPALDPAPFAAWLGTLGTNAEAIGRVVGMDASQVRKYLKGERAVVLDVVDRALLEANTLTTLDDLYPMGRVSR